MPQRPLVLKILIVAGFSFIWFLIALGRIDRPVALRIDVDCVMGLASTFQQGSISGRDYQYTYGPVAQVLAWIGVQLHSADSAFDGFGLSVLVWYSTAAVLFAAILLCIPGLRPLDCLLVYVASIGFDLLAYYPFSDVASFRVLMVLIAVVAAARSLAAEKASHRRVWGAAAGILCLIGQLTTIELGLQAAAAITLLTLTLAVLYRSEADTQRRGYWETLALILGIFAAGNVLISGYFWLSGHNYSFLDYQRYAMETIASYIYGSQLPWEFGFWRTAGLVLVTLCTYATVWLTAERMERRDRIVMLGLACASLLCVKNTLVRSDVTHIKAAMVPVLFLLLLLGHWMMPQIHAQERQWRAAAVWITLLLIAWTSWPNNAASTKDFFDGVRALVAGDLGAMKHAKANPAVLLPPAVLKAVADSQDRPMLNFPYSNHVAALLNRRMVAPVLQSFAANTAALQTYYIAGLGRPENLPLDVTYDVDEVGAWPVDGAQTISRLPIIFDYFLRNFRLAGGDPATLVLRRQSPPRELEFTNLAFQTVRHEQSVNEVELTQPSDCALVRLDMQVTYPRMASLWKASRLDLRILFKQEPVVATNLVPIARGARFYTFVNVAPPRQFFKYFADQAISGPQWDRLIVERNPDDKTAIGPDMLQIISLSCVHAKPFIERTVIPARLAPTSSTTSSIG